MATDSIRHQLGNVRLLWAAGHFDGDNDHQLKSSDGRFGLMLTRIDHVNNVDECLQFLNQNQSDSFIVIVPGALGEHIVPLIHHLSHVHSIVIYCHNTKRHRSWAAKWLKIRGLCVEIDSLQTMVRDIVKTCVQESVTISIIGPDQTNIRDLNQLDPSFMYTQLFKEVLVEAIKDDDINDDIKKLTNFCRTMFADNPNELSQIDRFEREFHNHTPIWWYTYECFLFPMLNRSLRLFDADLILKLGFFISRLHLQIEKLHQEQSDEFQNEFHVYRGQALSKSHFERLQKSKGGLLSFNNFLSTSRNRKVSSSFAYASSNNPDSVGILFNMTIDPRYSSTAFALLNNESFYKDVEQEILFSMNTVFRIGDIEPIDSDKGVWEVELQLTLDNDPHLIELLKQLRSETQGLNGWERLGRLTIRIGLYEKAEEIYNLLLEEPQHEIISAYFYFQLGLIKYQQGLYKKSIDYHKKSLEIRLRNLPPDHPQIAMSYNGLGADYHSLGDYTNAASYYEQALAIREKTSNPNDRGLVGLYNNLGVLYMHMKEFSKSLSFLEKLLRIDENTLPSTHPDLALSYNNIGGLYEQMEDYQQAIVYFKKGLDIRQKSLPQDHPDLPESYNNIASVYLAMNDFDTALKYHQHALEIRQKILAPNHPDLAFSFSNIGLVYDKMKDYGKAVECHRNALNIRRENLPAKHPEIATSHHNLAVVYINMEEFSKAYTHAEKAVQIAEQSLPPNHPNIQLFRTARDLAKNKM